MKDLPGQGPNKAAGNMLSIPLDVFPGRRKARKADPSRKRKRLAAKASRKRNRR